MTVSGASLRKLFQRRWVQILIVLTAFVGAVALLSPYALSVALEATLRDRGAKNVRIGDVALNIFTTRFAVRQLRVDPETGLPVDVGTIEGDISGKNLVRGRVLFDSLALRDVHIVLSRAADGKGWHIGGFDLAPGTAENETAGKPVLGVRELTIEDSTVRVEGAEGHLDLRIASGRVTNFVPWQDDAQVAVDAAGKIDSADFKIRGTLRPGGSRPGLDANIAFEGLRPGAFAMFVERQGLLPEGRIDLAGDVKARFDDGALAEAAYDGRLAGERIRLPADAGALPKGRFAFAGEVTARVDGKGNVRATYDGRVGGDQVVLPAELASREIEADTLSWQGKLSAEAAASGGISWQAGGRGTISRLAMPLQGDKTLRIGSADLDGIEVTGPLNIAIGSLRLADVVVRAPDEEKSPPFAAARLGATGLSISSGPVLHIEKIAGEGAKFSFSRDAGGVSGIHDAFRGAPPQPDAPAAGKKDEKGENAGEKPLGIRIDTVELAKEGIVRFRDSTVSPDVTVEWRFEQAKIADIDSTRPDAPMRIDVAGPTGDYGAITVTGQMKPFADPVTADAKAAFERVDLPPLSPYLSKYAGYAFRSGEGNMTVDAKVGAKGLDALAKITLRAMQVEPSRPEAAQEAEKALSMPLSAALSLLRDSNDDIRLEIPIDGNLASPEFDLGRVVAQATTGAIRKAGMTFLKYTLQPFGAALLVGDLARQFAGSIRLQPAVFEPGREALDQRHRDYISHLAKTLRERPNLRLTLCGRATPRDRSALAAARGLPLGNITDERLLELATARAESVKSALVGERSIAPERLISCGPKIDEAAEAEPRVEFVL